MDTCPPCIAQSNISLTEVSKTPSPNPVPPTTLTWHATDNILIQFFDLSPRVLPTLKPIKKQNLIQTTRTTCTTTQRRTRRHVDITLLKSFSATWPAELFYNSNTAPRVSPFLGPTLLFPNTRVEKLANLRSFRSLKAGIRGDSEISHHVSVSCQVVRKYSLYQGGRERRTRVRTFSSSCTCATSPLQNLQARLNVHKIFTILLLNT